jgi:hypothetical protein
MLLRRAPVRIPKGLSFDVADLLLVRAWADYHDLRMVVELDFAAERDEFEEIIGLFAPQTGFRRWMLWRSATGIVAQPMVGRPRKFDMVADALEALIPVQD